MCRSCSCTETATTSSRARTASDWPNSPNAGGSSSSTACTTIFRRTTRRIDGRSGRFCGRMDWRSDERHGQGTVDSGHLERELPQSRNVQFNEYPVDPGPSALDLARDHVGVLGEELLG